MDLYKAVKSLNQNDYYQMFHHQRHSDRHLFDLIPTNQGHFFDNSSCTSSSRHSNKYCRSKAQDAAQYLCRNKNAAQDSLNNTAPPRAVLVQNFEDKHRKHRNTAKQSIPARS